MIASIKLVSGGNAPKIVYLALILGMPFPVCGFRGMGKLCMKLAHHAVKHKEDICNFKRITDTTAILLLCDEHAL